jgi:hypothetical protein
MVVYNQDLQVLRWLQESEKIFGEHTQAVQEQTQPLP